MPDFNRMANLKASPSTEDLRREIVVAVENGEISPEDAERKAREMGLGGFSRYPELNAFSAMDLDVWSLDMALAWIIWRTREKVEEYWLVSEAFGWGWKAIWQRPQIPTFGRMPTQTLSGYRLVPSRPNSIFSESGPSPLLFFCDRRTPQAKKRLDRVVAERALRSALIQSQLIASAKECSTEKIIDIPPREWSRFQYDTTAETRLFIPPERIYEPEDAEVLYKEIEVFKNDLTNLWPESGSDLESSVLAMQPTESQLEVEYEKWLSTQTKKMQIIGRWFLDEWKLHIRPIDDLGRARAISEYALRMGAKASPGDRTISRFFELVRPWLHENRP